MGDAPVWYLGTHGQQRGPLSSRQIADLIGSGTVDQTAYVYGPQLGAWTPISAVAEYAALFHAAQRPPAPPPAAAAPPVADQIDYEISGGDMQFVEVTLDPGEACVAEASSFFYMDTGIELKTTAGPSPLMTEFGNADRVRRRVAFAAPHPGAIVPIDLRAHRGELLCQKDAFLCAAKGIGIESSRRLGAGASGGEGFPLQRLEGNGLAFVHACGAVVARELAAGEIVRLQAGCLVAFEPSVSHDVSWASGTRGALAVNDGLFLFLATLTGPGRVWLQSLSVGRMASRVRGIVGP